MCSCASQKLQQIVVYTGKIMCHVGDTQMTQIPWHDGMMIQATHLPYTDLRGTIILMHGQTELISHKSNKFRLKKHSNIIGRRMIIWILRYSRYSALSFLLCGVDPLFWNVLLSTVARRLHNDSQLKRQGCIGCIGFACLSRNLRDSLVQPTVSAYFNHF